MKTTLIAIVTTLSLTAFANSTKGKNHFPGYGFVSSNQVCMTENTVRFTMPTSTVKTCVQYNSPLLGHNCLKYKTTTKKAIIYEAPLSFEVLGCLETITVYDHSNSPTQYCTKTGLVMYHQPRTYLVAKTVQVDEFQAAVIYEEHTIPACH